MLSSKSLGRHLTRKLCLLYASVTLWPLTGSLALVLGPEAPEHLVKSVILALARPGTGRVACPVCLLGQPLAQVIIAGPPARILEALIGLCDGLESLVPALCTLWIPASCRKHSSNVAVHISSSRQVGLVTERVPSCKTTVRDPSA